MIHALCRQGRRQVKPPRHVAGHEAWLTLGSVTRYKPRGVSSEEQDLMRTIRQMLQMQVVAIVALAAMIGHTAQADLIDYTIVMDNVSGFFDNAAFTGQQVTITMTADTTTVAPYGPPSSPFGYSNSVTPGGSTPITVQVGSGPLANITTAMTISGPNQFANNALSFYIGSSISSPRGFTYTWDSSYPGAQAVLTTPQTSTNSGLQVDSAFLSNPLSLSGGGTFYVDATATGQPGGFSSVAVPEPGVATGLAAAVLAGVGLICRRQRRN